jgi:DNA repair photolyase
VKVIEQEAKSILMKRKQIDSWFLSRYGMNFYRGCLHDCAYCDGRAEKYQVDNNFGHEVIVKSNAIELLRKELNPRGRRFPLKRSFVTVGGGVGDSYQQIESKYKITREALKIVRDFHFPAFVLTKSSLVERDIDILTQINSDSRVLFCMSFSSVDDKISRIFEPLCSPPSRRLETIKLMKDASIPVGAFYMPVIPGVTDSLEMITESFKKFKEAGVDFVLFGGMTLKQGRQMDFFNSVLESYNPEILNLIKSIYGDDQYGSPKGDFYKHYSDKIIAANRDYKIPIRIPTELYNDILETNDLVSVILQDIEYLLKMKGKKSTFGYSSYLISKLKEPLTAMGISLLGIKGINKDVEKVIDEVIQTGRSTLLDSLVAEF